MPYCCICCDITSGMTCGYMDTTIRRVGHETGVPRVTSTKESIIPMTEGPLERVSLTPEWWKGLIELIEQIGPSDESLPFETLSQIAQPITHQQL